MDSCVALSGKDEAGNNLKSLPLIFLSTPNSSITNSIVCSQVSIGTKCKVLNSQMAFGSSVQQRITLKYDIRMSIV